MLLTIHGLLDLPYISRHLYHLTHCGLLPQMIPVASDNPVHYADAIRYNARTHSASSLLPLTRLVLGMILTDNQSRALSFSRSSLLCRYSPGLRTRVLRFKPQHPGKLPCFISGSMNRNKVKHSGTPEARCRSGVPTAQRTSCTVSLSKPPVVTAQCGASRSQRSAQADSQFFSVMRQTPNPSEHHR